MDLNNDNLAHAVEIVNDDVNNVDDELEELVKTDTETDT